MLRATINVFLIKHPDNNSYKFNFLYTRNRKELNDAEFNAAETWDNVHNNLDKYSLQRQWTACTSRQIL